MSFLPPVADETLTLVTYHGMSSRSPHPVCSHDEDPEDSDRIDDAETRAAETVGVEFVVKETRTYRLVSRAEERL